MFNFFKKKEKNKDGFPLSVKGFWYSYSWYSWLCKCDILEYGDRMSGDKANSVSPATDRIAFNHFRCGIKNDNKTNLIDGLIPAIRIGDKIGLYKVVKGPYYRKHNHSDRAGWDDGKEIDLKFVKSIKDGGS